MPAYTRDGNEITESTSKNDDESKENKDENKGSEEKKNDDVDTSDSLNFGISIIIMIVSVCGIVLTKYLYKYSSNNRC